MHTRIRCHGFGSTIGVAGLALLLTAAVPAQQKKAPLSPPEVAHLEVSGQTVTIQYSAPSLRGRTHIFDPGGLISHDANYPVWRAGANAATTLRTTANLRLGSLMVPRGTYTLYVLIANPNRWQLIVNKDTGQWGLTYKKELDLGRVPMQMSTPAKPVERLRYLLTPHSLTLEWGHHVATVPLELE